jgi:hypothetical protein
MPNTNHKKECNMATSPAKEKNAMKSLLDCLDEVIDKGAEKMDAEQLRKSEKRFNDVVDRAVANKRRRETA